MPRSGAILIASIVDGILQFVSRVPNIREPKGAGDPGIGRAHARQQLARAFDRSSYAVLGAVDKEPASVNAAFLNMARELDLCDIRDTAAALSDQQAYQFGVSLRALRHAVIERNFKSSFRSMVPCSATPPPRTF